MFGYLDESGAPGKATKQNDYFVVSLVIFKNRATRDNAINEVGYLRTALNLPDDYEFHCSRNTNKVQSAFIKLLSHLDFSFITVALKKDEYGKRATNIEIAERLIGELTELHQEIKIEMDTNFRLHDRLRKEIRKRGLTGVSIRECKSKGNQLIQIADYIANISYKYVRKPAKAKTWFYSIKKKCQTFIIIQE